MTFDVVDNVTEEVKV